MGEEVPEIVKNSFRKLPHFQDGRVDYSDAEKAAVLVVFLKHEDEILILKRSEKVNTRRRGWGVVAGYLDELKPVVEKALEEVREETGISEEEISNIQKGDVFEFDRKGIRFVSFPFLMELKRKPKVELSWEHTEYKWINLQAAGEYLPLNAIKEFRNVFPNIDE